MSTRILIMLYSKLKQQALSAPPISYKLLALSLTQNNIFFQYIVPEVMDQIQMRVFYQGIQIQIGQVLLLFRGIWSPLMKHETRSSFSNKLIMNSHCSKTSCNIKLKHLVIIFHRQRNVRSSHVLECGRSRVRTSRISIKRFFHQNFLTK